jgi:hypothetical protein
MLGVDLQPANLAATENGLFVDVHSLDGLTFAPSTGPQPRAANRRTQRTRMRTITAIPQSHRATEPQPSRIELTDGGYPVQRSRRELLLRDGSLLAARRA